jgi:hypothetical protein
MGNKISARDFHEEGMTMVKDTTGSKQPPKGTISAPTQKKWLLNYWGWQGRKRSEKVEKDNLEIIGHGGQAIFTVGRAHQTGMT